MGEISEMMLDGTMCQQCGEYLGTDNGYPTTCAGCGGDDLGITEEKPRRNPRKQTKNQRRAANKIVRDKVKDFIKNMSGSDMCYIIADNLNCLHVDHLRQKILEEPVLRHCFVQEKEDKKNEHATTD